MKRISRRDLKEKIKDLRHELDIKQGDIDRARNETKECRERLFKLGMDESLEDLKIDGPIKQYEGTFEIEPEEWGQYIVLTDDATEKIADMAAQRLTESIAKSLIKSGIARVIVKQPDFPGFSATVGVKLAVVPWEELTERRLLVEVKKMKMTL